MKRLAILMLASAMLLSGCGGKAGDSEQAHEALVSFFERLASGDYAGADKLYGGSYETLINWNPLINPEDHAALWRNGCQMSGLQCTRILTSTFNELTGEGQFVFTVQFARPDGTLFVTQPCCGANPTSPPAWQFEYHVVRDGEGNYRVLDMPVYMP